MHWLRYLQPTALDAGSVVVAHGFIWPMAHRVLVPGPGIEPVSPAVAGRFFFFFFVQADS